jgi:lysozyme
MCVLCWGVIDAAQASGCAVGWGQLLSAEQRAALSPACALSAPPPPAGLLAQQMSMYTQPVVRGAPAYQARTVVPQHPGALHRQRPAAGAPAARGAPGALPATLAPLIDRTAQAHDIDPLLLHAIARVESRHQPRAVSPAGAHGLMQVIVPTARRFGVDAAPQLHDPQTNLQVSARYLKTLQQRFGNDLPLVLAAYNAGEGAVERHGRRVPPYRETQDYVRKVLSEYSLLRRVSARREPGASLAEYPL